MYHFYIVFQTDFFHLGFLDFVLLTCYCESKISTMRVWFFYFSMLGNVFSSQKQPCSTYVRTRNRENAIDCSYWQFKKCSFQYLFFYKSIFNCRLVCAVGLDYMLSCWISRIKDGWGCSMFVFPCGLEQLFTAIICWKWPGLAYIQTGLMHTKAI